MSCVCGRTDGKHLVTCPALWEGRDLRDGTPLPRYHLVRVETVRVGALIGYGVLDTKDGSVSMVYGDLDSASAEANQANQKNEGV